MLKPEKKNNNVRQAKAWRKKRKREFYGFSPVIAESIKEKPA
jgi:hypothetical protein